ncbi:MAG: lipoyl(octanoyl) transferase LipB [Nitriliruptorales bacterium]|nr:lipoyl(octanoyl) transferase LipB [Nitriliruptorales bacterium]
MTATPDFTTLRAERDAPLVVVRAGQVPYGTAWAWQRELVERRQADDVGDVLLLLEHPPVYTAGRRAEDANLLFDDSERARRGIELFRVDRGGDFTYHGPGQLVGYPILRLDGPRVVDHVRALEQVGIDVAAGYGIEAGRIEGMSGVWVGTEKLMAIGVRVSSGYVTQHGMAFNVHPDMAHFAGIVPCGIEEKGVCSLVSLGVDADVDEVAGRYARAFLRVYGGTVEAATPADLGLVSDASATA